MYDYAAIHACVYVWKKINAERKAKSNYNSEL